MFGIVTIKQNQPNLELLNAQGVLTTKVASDGGRNAYGADQNGGAGFGTVYETIGSTQINAYLIPLANPDYFRTTGVGGGAYVSTYNNRDPLFRVAFPIQAKAGKSISGFFIENMANFVNIQGSGVTANYIITLKRMASNGTLTTIATSTTAVSAMLTYVSIGASGTPTVMNAGDRLVMEFALVRTGGTHNTTNWVFAYCGSSTTGGHIIDIF